MFDTQDLTPSARRLLLVCIAIFLVSTVGLILGLVFEWPAQLGGGSDDGEISVGEVVANGTVTSLPLAPWVALTLFGLLALSRRWWGTVAVVVLCLLGPLFMFGGLGEAFADSTPHVPRAVLITAGVVYGGLGLALLLSGVAELVERARTRRRAPLPG